MWSWSWTLLVKSSVNPIKTRLFLIHTLMNIPIHPSGTVPRAYCQKPTLGILAAVRPRIKEVIAIIFSVWIRRNCFRSSATTTKMHTERPSSQEQVLGERHPLISFTRVTVKQQFWCYQEWLQADSSSCKWNTCTVRLDLLKIETLFLLVERP